MAPGATIHALGHGGLVRDWLVAGPWHGPVVVDHHLDRRNDPFSPTGRWLLSKNPEADDLKLAILRQQALNAPPAVVPEEGTVVAWGPLRDIWRRRSTDDGPLEMDGFAFTARREDVLAGLVLRVPETSSYVLSLAATGSLTVTIDGDLIHRDLFVSTQHPAERRLTVFLDAGDHPLLVASTTVGMREYRHMIGMSVIGRGVEIVLPSPGADPDANVIADRILDDVGVRSWTSADGRWTVTGPDGAELVIDHHGVQTPLRLAGGEAVFDIAQRPDDAAPVISAPRRGERSIEVRTADPAARAVRQLRLIQVPADYRSRSHGDASDRAREVLAHAAESDGGVATQLARAALGATAIDAGALTASLELIECRGDCADFEVVALANLWHRAHPDAWSSSDRQRVADALCGFKYWLDEPGLDCMCYFTENHQLVYHVGQLLCGELFRERIFSNTGWLGRYHVELAEQRLASWLAQRLRHGFVEFDSNTYFAIDVLALTSVIEFATNDDLRAGASAVLDLVLFQLACNSWRGIHGCSHGRSYAQALVCGRLEETSPLQRIAWGTGALNEALLPAVVFAAAQRYSVPEAIRRAGGHYPDRWRGWQRSAGDYVFERDLRKGPWSASSVVFKTPDAMLASVQDYRPGSAGYQEHVWNATLGPDTSVFATHPANTAVTSSARPNAWAGNRLLPRVRQHDDALIAVHKMPLGDPLGYTHAWFPTGSMDAWSERDGWLVGCVGDGYVALTADRPLRFVERGVTAGQEVICDGGRKWVCQIGRRATHGSFTTFQDALQPPLYDDDGVRYRTPDGRVIDLGWRRGWLLDGRPDVEPEDFPRFRNPLTDTPFGAAQVRIEIDGHVHEIDLRHEEPQIAGR